MKHKKTKAFGLNKRAALVAVAACTAVGATGVGAVTTGNTGIFGNTFTKDAAAAFTFTGSPFKAHYNADTKSYTEEWTANNKSTSETEHFDGVFAKQSKGTLPVALEKELKIQYSLGGKPSGWMAAPSPIRFRSPRPSRKAPVCRSLRTHRSRSTSG